jgi:hypothetical protein
MEVILIHHVECLTLCPKQHGSEPDPCKIDEYSYGEEIREKVLGRKRHGAGSHVRSGFELVWQFVDQFPGLYLQKVPAVSETVTA